MDDNSGEETDLYLGGAGPGRDTQEIHAHRCGLYSRSRGQTWDEQSGVARSSESAVRKTWLYILVTPLAG